MPYGGFLTLIVLLLGSYVVLQAPVGMPWGSYQNMIMKYPITLCCPMHSSRNKEEIRVGDGSCSFTASLLGYLWGWVEVLTNTREGRNSSSKGDFSAKSFPPRQVVGRLQKEVGAVAIAEPSLQIGSNCIESMTAILGQ